VDENFDGDAAEDYKDDLESEGDEDLSSGLGIETEGT
jgi:ATP-dependent RNA helicase DHX37/DHR1